MVIKGMDKPEDNKCTLEILPDGSVYKQDVDWGTFFPTEAIALSDERSRVDSNK